MIFLLTDFGLENHYVGVMKAIIASANPHIPLIDLTHLIAPGAISDAAYEIWAAWDWIPLDSILVAIVDPGVGSQRSALGLRIDRRVLIGPDNGIFTDIMCDHAVDEAVMLSRSVQTNAKLRGLTFDGRDLFAPAAAQIAAGAALSDLGPQIDPQTLVRLEIPHATIEGGVLTASVRRIDRFGNLITNCRSELFVEWAHDTNNLIAKVEGQAIELQVTNAYAAVPQDELAALVNSAGLLEIAVNGGSAAERLGVTHSGGEIEVRRSYTPS